MKLKIEIDLDNAAFEDGDTATEIKRMLRVFANEYEGKRWPNAWPVKLRDSNGNTVGKAVVE